MKERIDVIQSIKSSESASSSIGRKKLVDLGKPGSHGLLSEMSLVELKERLELKRQETGWQVREKRDRIVRAKRDWDEARLEKLQYISSLRVELSALENEYVPQYSIFKANSELNKLTFIRFDECLYCFNFRH